MKSSLIFSTGFVNEDNVEISVPETQTTVDVQVNSSHIDGFLSKYLTIELIRKLDGDNTSLGTARVKVSDILNSVETFQFLKLYNNN